MRHFKRYDIVAKRRNTDESWSAWSNTNDYEAACRIAAHCEEVGYASKIVINEKSVEKLWEILGEKGSKTADVILNSGFRMERDTARDIFAEIEKEITAALKSNYKAKKEHIENNNNDAEFLSHIDGKINTLRGIEGFIEELRKQYDR